MFDENMSDEEFIGWLEDEGALFVDGVDQDGQLVLKMNPDRMQEVCPELYEIFTNDLSDTLMDLYKLGLVDVMYDDNLEARFKISEAGQEYLKNNGYHMDGENND